MAVSARARAFGIGRRQLILQRGRAVERGQRLARAAFGVEHLGGLVVGDGQIVLRGGVARVLAHLRLVGLEREPFLAHRLVALAERGQDVGGVAARHRQVGVEHGVVGIARRGPFEHRNRLPHLHERAGLIADVRVVGVAEHVADLVEGHAPLAQVGGMVGRRLGQSLHDAERKTVLRQGLCGGARGREHVAEATVAHDQVAPGSGRGGGAAMNGASARRGRLRQRLRGRRRGEDQQQRESDDGM